MRLALRGRRNLDGHTERITAADELAAVRAQAVRIVLKSAAATAAVAVVLNLID